MKLFFKKKDLTIESQQKYGYSYEPVPREFDMYRLQICLMKASLIGCASIGTVGSVVSAFKLAVNMSVIILCLLTFSIFLAMLNYNSIFFHIAYPVLFFSFAFSIFQNRIYVNSGYHAMVNIIRESYRDYFELDYSLQAVETITDRHQTMTYALIYMGFFLVVLLNIFISNYMSSFWTIILTFPFFQIGLYIGKMPALIYMALLIFSYTAVVLLKRSGHYSLSKNKKKDKPFIRRKQIVTYKGHGKTMVQILGGACVLALCFSVITYPLMNADSFTFHSKSKLKIVADSYVRTFVQNGLLGFFNRYQAAGGTMPFSHIN